VSNGYISNVENSDIIFYVVNNNNIPYSSYRPTYSMAVIKAAFEMTWIVSRRWLWSQNLLLYREP